MNQLHLIYMSENNTEKPKENTKLPTHPVEILKMKKGGSITIPKDVRERLGYTDENLLKFAFWEEEDKLVLQLVNEEEILQLQPKESPKIQKEKSSGESKPRKKKEKPSENALQPELTKYIPFQLENQDKIINALESIFYILVETPPKIQDAIERLKYIVINYSTGASTNDARLKNTLIIFISDILSKSQAPELKILLDFANQNLIPHIKSAYLKEQSLITLMTATILCKEEELGIQLLKQIIIGIMQYSEPFAIMQGFKGLVKSITNLEDEVPEKVKNMIGNYIEFYIPGNSIYAQEDSDDDTEITKMNSDNSVQLIDLLQDLQLIERAFTIAQNLLNSLPPDDIYIESVRQKISELKKVNI